VKIFLEDKFLVV